MKDCPSQTCLFYRIAGIFQCLKKKLKRYDTWDIRVFGPFCRPIFRLVPNGKNMFFPNFKKKKIPIKEQKNGEKNDKLSPFYGMFLFSNSITREIIDDCMFF